MANHTTEDFSSLVESTASIYATDSIIVLGKGPSADEVDPSVFADVLVIGLNDAERIAPADISIFHADWVKDALADSGYQSRVYVTSTDFNPPNRNVVHLPYRPLTNDTADLMMQRFLATDEIAIEEVMFLTALEVARMVATQRDRSQTVYMVGFDFAPELGYSEAITSDHVPESQDDRTAIIHMQEYFLLNTLYMLRDSNLQVAHVGTRPFSALTPSELNARFVKRAAHLPGQVVHGPEVAITAELTTNHFGDRRRLERLIRAAKAAGADLVKVQKREVESFYTPEQLAAPYVSPFGPTFGDYRRALELDKDDFAFIGELCRELNLEWFASVLDQQSFEFIMEFEPTLLKLPSTISEHKDYLTFVAQNYDGDLVLSTGMTDVSYERWVLDTFGDRERLYLLHCNSAYPTPDHHCNIGVVRHYEELSHSFPQLIPGYSSHDHGWMASALAVAAGAQMVEKHVKLGNTEWAHFDAVAVDLATDEFSEYVRQVRKAQTIVGSSEKQVTESEHHKYVPGSTGTKPWRPLDQRGPRRSRASR